MSPKNLQTPVEVLSLVTPEAPSHTIVGKINMMQHISKIPFTQIPFTLGKKGTLNKANNKMIANQKIPRTRTGLKLRANNMPNENGNIMRRNPPKILTESPTVQPTPTLS